MEYSDIISFHGHSCPGLAIGYRLTLAAMKALGVSRSEDEELVALVESDACGVDALQFVSGCTIGKGNLKFLDEGKHAYTIYSRVRQNGVRVIFHGREIPDNVREDRLAYAQKILSEPERSIITVTHVAYQELNHAKIRKTVVCCSCNESVMETRTLQSRDGFLCLSCSKTKL